MILQGQIFKGVGGFYYVKSKGDTYTLKAPGRFRKEGIKPIVGDIVEFNDKDGIISGILNRRNQFYRPAVSNVTQSFIVLTGAYPKADLLLIDKLIVQCEYFDVNIILVINKCDIMDIAEIENIKNQYSHYDIICCSTVDGSGIDEIKDRIKNNVSFFAGQSGVGKSSIINAVCEDYEFETGAVSEKLKRGKHTTRHVELVHIPKLEGALLDTPGFSFFDLRDEFNLEACYREFDNFRDQCKFKCCSHISEPNCAVKEHVGKEINKERYERYIQLYKSLEEMRNKQYD